MTLNNIDFSVTKIKIATFNVNSIKARLLSVATWLKHSNPDIILLQEIKCLEHDFPCEIFFDLGYNCAISGQKTYNGVAILSKFKIEDVVKALPQGKIKAPFLDQARYIEAVIVVANQAIRVASVYVPNGGGELLAGQNLEDSDKFHYKLDFFDALNQHFSTLLSYDEIAVFGGDYNVAAENIDIYDPKNLSGTVCFHPLERQKFRSLLNLGLADTFRQFNPSSQNFSWWDYRGNSWQYNKGMRIDYLLASPKAMDKASGANIEDKGVRNQEKASDHCPVIFELEI